MILVDTSVWIEFFRAREPIYSVLASLLEENRVCTVEWIFGELLQGVKAKREKFIVKEYWKNVPKVKVEEPWIGAGERSSSDQLKSKGIGLIDSAIIVSAKKVGIPIWTLDKKIQKYLGKSDLFRLER